MVDQPPIVLVHGVKDTSAKMRHLANRLQKLGRETYSIDLYPKDCSGKLELLAAQLHGFIDRHLGPHTPCDLVGFSMGGLVTRYYVQRLDGIDRVRRYVTIAAPHQGTIAAYFSQKPGCIQMRPGSEFLQDLAQDVEILKKLDFTSIWTPFDAIILPATSSQLPLGQDICLPVIAHPLMVSDQRSLNAVAQALNG